MATFNSFQNVLPDPNNLIVPSLGAEPQSGFEPRAEMAAEDVEPMCAKIYKDYPHVLKKSGNGELHSQKSLD